MTNEKMNLYVVIPSSQQDSGISEEYFEDYPMLNLLPLGHKSTIQQLIDDLLKLEKDDKINELFQLKSILLGTSETNRDKYCSSFPKKDSRLDCQFSHTLSHNYGMILSRFSGQQVKTKNYLIQIAPVIDNR
jgi:hypothetical protein